MSQPFLLFTEGFTDIPKNSISLAIFLILFSIACLLIIAMWSEKIRTYLVNIRLLEKDEAPKSLLLWLIGVVIIVKLVQAFVIQPFIVDGGSMKETLHSGEMLLVDKLSYRLRTPARGEVIVFKYNEQNTPYAGRYLIKRIIGLPGETIRIDNGITTITSADGTVISFDEPYLTYRDTLKRAELTLGKDEYFVMGDNRPESYDSRMWGALHETDIRGRALLRLKPLTKISLFPGDYSK